MNKYMTESWENERTNDQLLHLVQPLSAVRGIANFFTRMQIHL